MRTNPTPTRTLHCSNGNTLVIEPISQFWRSKLLAQSERDLRDDRPEPPMFQSDFSEKALPNPTDPDYVAAMERWRVRVNAQLFAHAIAMATKYTLGAYSNEELTTMVEETMGQRQAESERFADYYAEAGLPLEEVTSYSEFLLACPAAENIRVRYVIGCVLQYNDGDLIRLSVLVQSEMELEEAVQSMAESFQGDVPGEVNLEDQSAVVGAAV